MRSKTVAAVILLGVLLMVAWPTWRSWQSQPPDFSLYPAGEARKSAFFSYLGPLVDQENERWRQQRTFLLALKASTAMSEPEKCERSWLNSRAEFFGVSLDQPIPAQIDELLFFVDEIPRSLALAQAAKESAWGTSRFAADGNNYFGQRCYSKGCGLIPASRPAGAKFEVRRFDSAQASVQSYMNNINSHPEYDGFRSYRAAQRADNQPLSGIQAAEQLTQYSERRQAYVDEIQSLIYFNRLDRTDQPEKANQEPVTL